MFNSNIPDEILRQYSESNDFGFSTVDNIPPTGQQSEEMVAIKEKLDLILSMNSTCSGALEVKAQYDILLKARLLEIERTIIPLLLNLKKQQEKDYIHWPGAARVSQCDLQIFKITNLTRNNL